MREYGMSVTSDKSGTPAIIGPTYHVQMSYYKNHTTQFFI